MLHQLNGGRIIYSDVPKKTAGEAGTEKNEWHFHEKRTLLGTILTRILGESLSFHCKLDFYYPKTMLEGKIYPRLRQSKYMNPDITDYYSAKVENICLSSMFRMKNPPSPLKVLCSCTDIYLQMTCESHCVEWEHFMWSQIKNTSFLSLPTISANFFNYSCSGS